MGKSSLRDGWSKELEEVSRAEISQRVVQAGETARAKGLKQRCACWGQKSPGGQWTCYPVSAGPAGYGQGSGAGCAGRSGLSQQSDMGPVEKVAQKSNET